MQAIPGVVGVNRQSGQYQVIIGNAVSDYYREIMKLGDLAPASAATAAQPVTGNLLDRFTNFISACMSPLIPALIGGGMIKVLLIVLTGLNWLAASSQTYTVLSVLGDAPFYFLPIELAITAAKYFRVNQMMAVMMAGIMIHPSLIALVGAGRPIHVMGLPMTAANYASSVIPILLVVWFMQPFEGLLDRAVPASLKSILKPLVEIFVVALVALFIIGSLGTWAGQGLSFVVRFAQARAAWLAMPLLAAGMPLIVMTGMHWAFAPLFLAASVATPDALIMPAMLASNLAQGAASLAVALRTKHADTRQVATAAAVSALVAGVTEPAMYGVTLKYKRPMIAAMIAGGVAGLYMGLVHLRAFAFAVPSLISLPQFMNARVPSNLINAGIVAAIAIVLSFGLTLLFGGDQVADETPASATPAASSTPAAPAAAVTPEAPLVSATPVTATGAARVTPPVEVYGPMSGTVVPLNEVADPAFQTGMIGAGVAVVPSDGQVVAPFDGVVEMVFETKHAIGLKGDNGVELLIHIGLDTVELNGAPFQAFVHQGQRVARGDLLIQADLAAIRAAGRDVTTPIIVTNTKAFAAISPTTKRQVTPNDVLLTLG